MKIYYFILYALLVGGFAVAMEEKIKEDRVTEKIVRQYCGYWARSQNDQSDTPKDECFFRQQNNFKEGCLTLTGLQITGDVEINYMVDRQEAISFYTQLLYNPCLKQSEKKTPYGMLLSSILEKTKNPKVGAELDCYTFIEKVEGATLHLKSVIDREYWEKIETPLLDSKN